MGLSVSPWRLVRMIEGGSLRAEKVKEFRYRINALRVFDASIPKPPAAVKPTDEEDAGADEAGAYTRSLQSSN